MTEFEKMGGTYSKVGDYYLPDLLPPETDGRYYGKYGRLREKYLKNHRKVKYLNLLTSGGLHSHLCDIDEQARNMVELLINQMAKNEGVTEQLKATDQMAWVGKINNIKARAEEFVYAEMIYEEG
jgi:hypothetical protein